MKFQCRIGWHNWSMWSDPKERKYHHVYSDGSEIPNSKLSKYFHSRRCQDCREYEEKETSTVK